SDLHHELVTRGSVITARGPAGEPCIAATYRHRLGGYLRAALSPGFPVRRGGGPGGAPPTRPPAPAPSWVGGLAGWPGWLMGCRRLSVIGHLALPAARRRGWRCRAGMSVVVETLP